MTKRNTSFALKFCQTYPQNALSCLNSLIGFINRYCERITHWQQLDSRNINTVTREIILKAQHLLWLQSGFRTGRPGCGRSLSWWCVVSEAPWLLMRTPALRTQNIASVTWPGPGSLDTRLLLVNTSHVTWILDCDWPRPSLVTGSGSLQTTAAPEEGWVLDSQSEDSNDTMRPIRGWDRRSDSTGKEPRPCLAIFAEKMIYSIILSEIMLQ